MNDAISVLVHAHNARLQQYREQLAALTAENRRLMELANQLAAEGFDRGVAAGLERAAEIAEQGDK